MAAATVKVEGLKELTANLRRVNRELPKGMTAIHKAIAAPVAEKARGKVRSRTGRLAGTVRPLASQRVARVAVGRANMVYAPINHYGGYPGDYAGNPFLTDALNESQGQIVRDYDRLVGVFIDKVWVDNYL